MTTPLSLWRHPTPVWELMYAVRPGTRVLRYVAWVCRHCGARNRTIVHTGNNGGSNGEPMTRSEVRRNYGPLLTNTLGDHGACEAGWSWPRDEGDDSPCPPVRCVCGAQARLSMHATFLGYPGAPLADVDPQPEWLKAVPYGPVANR